MVLQVHILRDLDCIHRQKPTHAVASSGLGITRFTSAAFLRFSKLRQRKRQRHLDGNIVYGPSDMAVGLLQLPTHTISSSCPFHSGKSQPDRTGCTFSIPTIRKERHQQTWDRELVSPCFARVIVIFVQPSCSPSTSSPEKNMHPQVPVRANLAKPELVTWSSERSEAEAS